MERAELDFNDFIKQNKDTIHCLAMQSASVLFSAAAAVRTFGEPGPSWWVVFARAVDATAQLYGCLAPPHEIYEEAFEGEGKRCQCAEVGGQLFLEWLDATGNRTKLSNSGLAEAKEIKNAVVAEGIASCNWVTVNGEAKVASYDIQDGVTPIWYIVPTLDTDCCYGTISPPPVQPRPEPYVFPGSHENCESTVILIDSCIDKYGLAQNFYRVDLWQWREDYQVPQCVYEGYRYYWETISGPYIYYSYGSPHEGFTCTPVYAPPHPDAPEPGSVFGGGNSGLSAVTYTLHVPCSYNQETDEFDKKYNYDVEATSSGILGLARRMDALAWMINNAQLIPYTDCSNEKPVLEGQWVTTRWESNEKMVDSGRRLRKLFRYRTKSTRDLGQLSAYWRDFTWKSGPVCVIHKGAWWGTPQVWAESEKEGRRVIRHAASEAGLDPDQVGRWGLSSSNSPRYGMSGTMRILKKEGFPWVASRQGTDWPNYLAQ